MIDPTYQQLVESNFIPIRLQNNEKYPEYMGFEQEDLSIIAMHVINDEYVIHSLTNKYSRLYDQKEIDSLPKFDSLNSIPEIISFLKKDRTRSQFNLTNKL